MVEARMLPGHHHRADIKDAEQQDQQHQRRNYHIPPVALDRERDDRDRHAHDRRRNQQ